MSGHSMSEGLPGQTSGSVMNGRRIDFGEVLRLQAVRKDAKLGKQEKGPAQGYRGYDG